MTLANQLQETTRDVDVKSVLQIRWRRAQARKKFNCLKIIIFREFQENFGSMIKKNSIVSPNILILIFLFLLFFFNFNQINLILRAIYVNTVGCKINQVNLMQYNKFLL